MPFERFVPPKTASSSPRATVRPSGLISFDAATVDAFDLDKATHAVIFFDKTRKLVGVQPVSSDKDSGAIKLTRRRRSVSLKAPEFFELYGLEFDEPQRFEVTRDRTGKMLLINMKSVQRRRGRRPKRL